MKIDLVFLIILGFMVLKTICNDKINNKEHMAVSRTTPTPRKTSTPIPKKTTAPPINANVRTAISQIYNANFTIVQKLLTIAIALQAGNYTFSTKLTVKGDIVASSKLIVNGIVNTKFITNESDVEVDWLRIGCNNSTTANGPADTGVGRIAMYGGVCINGETTNKKGIKYSGLAVGSWSAESTNVGLGNIKASGIISGADLCTSNGIKLKNLNDRLVNLERNLSLISFDSNGDMHVNGQLMIDEGNCLLKDDMQLYAFGRLSRGLGVRDNVNGQWPFYYNENVGYKDLEFGRTRIGMFFNTTSNVQFESCK